MKWLHRLIRIFTAPFIRKKSFTVHYAFPLVFTFAALLGAAAVITSDGKSSVRIEVSETSLQAGDRFEIDVYANATVAVNAVDIALRFPSEQIKVLSIDTGESVITLWAQDPYVKNSTVYLQGGTFRRGFIGNHLIATINAQAIETGLAQMAVGEVTLLAGDGSGSKVSVGKNAQASQDLYIAKAGELREEGEQGPMTLQNTASVVIVTDIDGDNAVTLADVSRFMLGWASKNVLYDFDGDGYMTFKDFGIILSDSFFR